MNIHTRFLSFFFCFSIFFFNDTATTEIYTRMDTLSLHDALPIYYCRGRIRRDRFLGEAHPAVRRSEEHTSELQSPFLISYAVFCLKKKKPSHPERVRCQQRHDQVHLRTPDRM